jgi:hypothetical protein
LESETVVGRCESAGERIARPGILLLIEERFDGLLETSFQQLNVTRVGDPSVRRQIGPLREMKSMDGVKEEQSPNPFVEVVALTSERLQLPTVLQ